MVDAYLLFPPPPPKKKINLIYSSLWVTMNSGTECAYMSNVNTLGSSISKLASTIV